HQAVLCAVARRTQERSTQRSRRRELEAEGSTGEPAGRPDEGYKGLPGLCSRIDGRYAHALLAWALLRFGCRLRAAPVGEPPFAAAAGVVAGAIPAAVGHRCLSGRPTLGSNDQHAVAVG